LTYFAAKGLMEPVRIMLAISGTEIEEERLPIDFATYARPEFDAMKAEGKFVVNMGRVPILTVDGATIGQSKTIGRFLAKRVGMAGANEVEEATVDMIGEHIRDIKDNYGKAKGALKDAELKEAKAKWVGEVLPVEMAKLEQTFGSAGFAVGSKMSFADIEVFSLLCDYFDADLLPAAAASISACPKISASVAAVTAASAAYMASRPAYAF